VERKTGPEPAGDSGATVFVVDDDPALCEALQLLLESKDIPSRSSCTPPLLPMPAGKTGTVAPS
jgi:hypothetical protein